MKKEILTRKTIRLTEYDYSSAGVYFVTICTENRHCFLSQIKENDDSIINNEIPSSKHYGKLTQYGLIVDDCINQIQSKYSNVVVDEYVIMPNHIHILLYIQASEDESIPSLSSIIAWLKYYSTVEINKIRKTPGRKVWQRSYYDHIIRNKHDYEVKARYIRENPINWYADKYFDKI